MHPGTLTEGDLDIHEESGCDEKDDDVPEEVMMEKSLTLRKPWEIEHSIENTDENVGS